MHTNHNEIQTAIAEALTWLADPPPQPNGAILNPRKQVLWRIVDNLIIRLFPSRHDKCVISFVRSSGDHYELPELLEPERDDLRTIIEELTPKNMGAFDWIKDESSGITCWSKYMLQVTTLIHPEIVAMLDRHDEAEETARQMVDTFWNAIPKPNMPRDWKSQ